MALVPLLDQVCNTRLVMSIPFMPTPARTAGPPSATVALPAAGDLVLRAVPAAAPQLGHVSAAPGTAAA